ncbi:MAG: ZIP family metal transporter [Planctomycetota bacterium]
MSSAVLLIVYCLAIIAASILGGLIPLVIRLTHTRLQVAISLTAGFMLGVALLHMIPHAIDTHAPGSGHGGVTPMTAMMGVLVGFMFMFFIERFFSFHTHEVAELDDAGKVLTSAEDLPDHNTKDHTHHQDHAHAHGMVGHTPGHKLSWTGAAIGMTLHSLIAGVALASAVASAPGNTPELIGESHGVTGLPGLAVFLVIVSHKPLDALTVITLTASAGFRKSTRHLINGLFALAVPLGVVLFAFGLSQTTLAESGTLVGLALAFSAGTFLCIALSDLLPELHFHAHDRTKLTAALVLGVVLAYVMATLEHSMHDHSGHDHSSDGQHDDHAGHGHGEGADDDHDGHDHGSHEGHDHGAPPSNTSDGWSDFLKRD